MIVRPVLMPTVDWETWNTLRREGGLVPASKGIDMKQPHAFIDLGNEHELRGCVLGFLVICDDVRLPAKIMVLGSQLIYQRAQYGSGDFEYLIVGSLSVLRALVINGSARSVDQGVRKIVNCIHAFMCQGGMKQLWEQYTKNALHDGTYTLDPRR